MSVPMKVFKAARLFSPHYVQNIKPESAPLNTLLNFPFITSSILSELTNEFPKYAVLASDISSEYDTLAFWKDHGTAIPKWSDAAKRVMVLQPFSAAAERVFSLLNNSSGNQQLSSLEDYPEASIMMQYKANI